MSVNSLASSNDSFSLSVIKSSIPFGIDCLIAKPASLIFISYTFFNIFFLFPICILILYHGLKQWWKQHSSSTAAMTSHSDSFMYHLITMEIIFVFGCTLTFSGICTMHLQMLKAGTHLFALNWFGEVFFYVLTCVERYLAVVHPIIFLSLKRERGIRIRNISISCIWLLCIGGAILITLEVISVIVMLCLLISSLIIIAYCCLSVLCILIRPGPGKQGRHQGRVDQSKQRAFYTIVAILGVLVLRCAWNLIWTLLYVSNTGLDSCVVVLCEVWMNVPSSLVLPLLFLQRAGMLTCCNIIK